MVLRHSITLGGYLRPLWWSQRKLGGMLAAPCGCFNVAEPYVVCLKRLLFNIWGMYRIDLKCFRNNQGIVAWKIFLHRKHKSLRMSRVVNVCLSIDWLRCLVCRLLSGFSCRRGWLYLVPYYETILNTLTRINENVAKAILCSLVLWMNGNRDAKTLRMYSYLRTHELTAECWGKIEVTVKSEIEYGSNNICLNE